MYFCRKFKAMKCKIFLMVLLTGMGVTAKSQHPEQKERGYIVKVGDKAPDISLFMLTGDTIKLSDLRHKIVVLQFTASWCSVCRKEMPHLEKEVWQRFKEKDFILIGVDYDEPLKKVKAFKKQMKVTYPFSLDPNADIFGKFANKKAGVTRNVVIDKTGTIVFLTRLYNTEEFNKMIKKIEQLVE